MVKALLPEFFLKCCATGVGAPSIIMMTYHHRNLGLLGGWLDYLDNGLKCTKSHDIIIASIAMFEWDPHFSKPPINYQKSSIQLAKEVLPHLGTAGIAFPSNVSQVVELLSCDPVSEREELKAFWDYREIRHRRTASGPFLEGNVRCSCKNSLYADTAI